MRSTLLFSPNNEDKLFDSLKTKINSALKKTNPDLKFRDYKDYCKYNVIPWHLAIKEAREENAGIQLIINNINYFVNGKHIPLHQLLTPKKIILDPLHKRFFEAFDSYILLLSLMPLVGIMGVSKALYSGKVKKASMFLAFTIACCLLISKVGKYRACKNIENILGDQFGEIKELCAEYYALKNPNAQNNVKNDSQIQRRLA